jgi:hypothetical protein
MILAIFYKWVGSFITIQIGHLGKTFT